MESVKLAAGEQPRYFTWPTGLNSGDAYFTTAAATSNPLPRDFVYQTFLYQATGFAGAVTYTAQLQGTNDPLSGMGLLAIPCVLNSSTTVTTSGNLFNSQMLANGQLGSAPGGLSQGVVVGMLVVGPGITPGTTVATVTNGNSIVLSAAATLTQNSTLRFYNQNWVNVGTAQTITAQTTTPAGASVASASLVDQSAFRWLRVVISAVTGAANYTALMGG